MQPVVAGRLEFAKHEVFECISNVLPSLGNGSAARLVSGDTHVKKFALRGSSERKVRRGRANLLGGRALRYELFGLVSKEVGFYAFDPLRFLNNGVLPKHYLSSSLGRWLSAYIAD